MTELSDVKILDDTQNKNSESEAIVDEVVKCWSDKCREATATTICCMAIIVGVALFITLVVNSYKDYS